MINAQPSTIESTMSLKEFFQNPSSPMKTSREGQSINSLIPIKSMAQRYRTVGNLGSGSFGTVSLAKVRSNAMVSIFEEMKMCPGTLMEPLKNVHRAKFDVVAIKTMTRRLPNLEDYSKVKEVRFILSVRSHPSLVQIYDIFIDKETFKLHIVMESMDQNLYQLMKYRKNCLFSPYTLKSILSQILAGIRHIHRHGYYHRDVKPENILIMQASNFYGSKENIPQNRKSQAYVIKLADYGLARQAENTRPYTAYVSTRWYRSPEILLRQKHYSYPVDIWAFGCVAVESATFLPLFPGSNELDQTWRVLEVLGCPEKSERAPLGGFWDDAQRLSSSLGFHLPKLPGATIEELIPRVDLPEKDRKDLCDVVKSCLIWDPVKRIDVHELCAMDYFAQTSLREPETFTEKPAATSHFKQTEQLSDVNAVSKAQKMNLNLATGSENQRNNENNSHKYWRGRGTNVHQSPKVNDENFNSNSPHRLRKVPHLDMNVFRHTKYDKAGQNGSDFMLAGGLRKADENSYREEYIDILERLGSETPPMQQPQPKIQPSSHFEKVEQKSQYQTAHESPEFEKPEQSVEWGYEDEESDYAEEIEDEAAGLIDPLYISNSYNLIQLDDDELPEKIPNAEASFDSQVCIVRGDERAQNLIDSINYALDEELGDYHDIVGCAWNGSCSQPGP